MHVDWPAQAANENLQKCMRNLARAEKIMYQVSMASDLQSSTMAGMMKSAGMRTGLTEDEWGKQNELLLRTGFLMNEIESRLGWLRCPWIKLTQSNI